MTGHAPNPQQIIADHQWWFNSRDGGGCQGCDWRHQGHHSDLRRDHAAHVLATICNSGLVVMAESEAEQQAQFIQDIATHGIHADLKPTRRWDGDQASEYRWWTEYVGDADNRLRRRAAAIRDAAPHL